MTLQTRLQKLEAIERAAAEAEYHAAISAWIDYIETLRPEVRLVYYRWLHADLNQSDISSAALELCGGRIELTPDDQPILDEIDRTHPPEIFERIEKVSRRLYPELWAQQASDIP